MAIAVRISSRTVGIVDYCDFCEERLEDAGYGTDVRHTLRDCFHHFARKVADLQRQVDTLEGEIFEVRGRLQDGGV